MAEDDRLPGRILLLLKGLLPVVSQAATQREALGDRDPLAGSDSLHVQPSAEIEQLGPRYWLS